jgi:hypothetical protein
MTCFKNLFKHLKNCDQTKTNNEMLRHDFQFFSNIMTFFSPKKRSNSPFSYLLFTFVQIFKPKKEKKLVVTCVFECFQSQCHILKELHEFLGMMGAITMFVKK